MKLVAFLGTDKGSLGQLTALINRMECEEVILVKDRKTPNYLSTDKCKIIEIDSSKDLLSFKEELQEKLRKELANDLEVALTIASGNGKEHMALLSSLLTLPVGIKLAAYTKKGVQFIS